MVFALAGLPVLGLLLGRPLTELTLFGIAPVPTILFTAGYLVQTRGWLKILWAIPLLMSVAALVLAYSFSIPEDFVLLSLPILFFASTFIPAKGAANS